MAVPVLKGYIYLLVVVDLRYAAGKRELVLAVARAAVSTGAMALLVKGHSEPGKAFSYGRQSLTPAAVAENYAFDGAGEQGCGEDDGEGASTGAAA